MTLKVNVPTRLTEKQKRLLEEFDSSESVDDHSNDSKSKSKSDGDNADSGKRKTDKATKRKYEGDDKTSASATATATGKSLDEKENTGFLKQMWNRLQEAIGRKSTMTPICV